MSGLNFGQLAGDDPVLADAQEFFEYWFEPDDLICFMASEPKKPKEHGYLTLEQFLAFDEKMFSDFVVGCDTYYVVGPSIEMTSHFRRGGDANLKSSVGVYADLDIKDAGFSTQGEILEFLGGLEIAPSVIVDSGSGGVHAYWKLSERMDRKEAKAVQGGWNEYLNYKAGDISIDALKDVSRVLRVPGSLRQPKSDEEPGAHVVRLAGGSREVHERTDLMKLCSPIHKAANRRKTAAKRVDDNLVSKSDDALVERINDLPWSTILTEAGWSFEREDYDGRCWWGRPGSVKSAAVEWPESPEVMSLMSGSPETGLLDLKEAGVILTKFRVALRLLAGDDLSKLKGMNLA